jgi:hypothetical protein
VTGLPICRLVQQAAQSISIATNTPVTFGTGSEEIDTNNFHDPATNNTRITPNVAGYYLFIAETIYAATTVAVALRQWVTKGGVQLSAGNHMNHSAGVSNWRSAKATEVVAMNGSTDFCESLTWTGTAASTNVAAGVSSTFQCIFLRPI